MGTGRCPETPRLNSESCALTRSIARDLSRRERLTSKPLPPGEVGGHLPVRAQYVGDGNGSMSGNAAIELGVVRPHPLDSSRPLPEGEVGTLTRSRRF